MGRHVLQAWALAPVKACLPLSMDYCNGARPHPFTHKTLFPLHIFEGQQGQVPDGDQPAVCRPGF